MYLIFLFQYYGSDTVSICTLDGTVKTILHKIRDDLLVYRKCFSGSHLITWIMKHPELFYQFGKVLLLTWLLLFSYMVLYVKERCRH